MADQDLSSSAIRRRLAGAKAWALGLVMAGGALLIAVVITAAENSLYRYARDMLQHPEATKVVMPRPS